MNNIAMLNEKIKNSGKKKSYLAKKCGLSRVGFANCVNNKAEFRSTHIQILCDELNINSLREKEAIFFAK